MKCKICDVEMVIGQAINPGYDENALYIAPVGNITNDTLELIDVWKCPKCGHQEYIEDGQ
jgi:hypothetical protein